MPAQQQFLDAIAATPDDHQLRLQFADWLEERGNPFCDEWRKGLKWGPSCLEYLGYENSGGFDPGTGIGFTPIFVQDIRDGDGDGNGDGYGDGIGDGIGDGYDYGDGDGDGIGDGGWP